MAFGGVHDPESRDRRAEEMWRMWRYGKMRQSDIAEELGVSRVWVNSEINRFIKTTERGRSEVKRYERIKMSKSEKKTSKSSVRRAKTIDKYRKAMMDVIGGMTVNEVCVKYGRSYQTVLKGFALVRDADPELYARYSAANRTHRFGWSRRKVAAVGAKGDDDPEGRRGAEVPEQGDDVR